MYRRLFDQHFPPQCAATVERWVPIWTKETDPSGRVSNVHVASTVHAASTVHVASSKPVHASVTEVFVETTEGVVIA